MCYNDDLRRSFRRRLDDASVVLFLIVLAFYLYTLAPSLNWADGARMQLDVMLGGSTYWSFEEASHVPTDGFPFDRLGVAAWDHPLYVMLGQLFIVLPWQEPTYGLNLLSAVAGAVAIVLVYQFGRFSVSDRWAAALGALAFAVSHTFWFHAVTSEVYTLHITFMISLIWLAVRWPQERAWSQLALFAFLAGLGLANHLMLGLTLVLLVGYMVAMNVTPIKGSSNVHTLLSPRQYAVLLKALSGWRGIAVVGLFIVGFAPWWLQFIRATRIINVPLTLEIALGYPWFSRRMVIQSFGMLLANLGGYAGWLLYQFTPIGVALGLYGFSRMWRKQRPVAMLLFIIFASHVLFSANYSLADQFNFHLPSYLVFALAITWGVAGLRRRWTAAQSKMAIGLTALLLVMIVVFPITLYALVPSTLAALGVTEASLGIQPIGPGVRDTLRYFLNPNKRGDDSAARFGRSTLAQVAPEALILTPKPSDQEAYVVLRYVQLIEKLRPDVRLELLLFEPGDDMAQVVLAMVQEQRGCRPLYLASLHPHTYPLPALERDFDIVPEANLFRLVPRQSPSVLSLCTDLERRRQNLSPEELIRRAMRWQ